MFFSEGRKTITIVLVAVDAIAIVISYLFAFVLRFIFVSQKSLDNLFLGKYYFLPLIFLPIWLLMISMEGAYEKRYLFVGSEEYRRLFHGGSLAALGTSFLVFLAKVDLSRGWMIASWVFGVLFLLIGRYAYRRHLYRVNKRLLNKGTILIVGANKEAADITKAVNAATHLGNRVVGVLRGPDAPASGVEVIDSISGLVKQVNMIKPKAVIVIPSALGSHASSVLRDLKGLNCNVYITPSLSNVVSSRISVQPVGGIPLIRVEEVRIDGFKGFVKRTFDFLAAVTLSAVLWPMFLTIAAAIKFDSKGPVFFKQKRVGREGALFNCYKFRSMVADAEVNIAAVRKLNEAKGHVFKIKNDPRITGVGRFIRRYSLDELPQLLNVIKGDMSLVGPRPPLPEEVAKYNLWEKQRLGAKPGMTGYWQINGRANDIFDFEEIVKMDLFYIENWSIALDLYILRQTLGVVLSAKGAY